MKEYVVRGRASVITSDLEVSCLTTEQLRPAIDWLIARDFCFEYDVVIGDSFTPNKYSIRIPQLVWANNLKEFASVLVQSDHLMLGEE